MNEDHETPGGITAIQTVTPAPETALTRHSGAAWALAELTDEEFAETMEAAKKGRDRLLQVMRHMMADGTHFGTIPGTDKKTILKPGIEVLCQMFSLIPDSRSEVIYGDGATSPHITVRSRCTVHYKSLDGPVVGIGEAAATSWEKKWRYRSAERTCPKCKKAAIIKGSERWGGGWVCWKKKDGCGAKWSDGAAVIESQNAGQVENPDPYEALNTIVKIANKRARFDAVITATSSSDLLTQDMEEAIVAPKEPAVVPDGDPSADDSQATDAAVFQVPYGKNKGKPVIDLTERELQWYIDIARANLSADVPSERPYDEREWLETCRAQLGLLNIQKGAK
jgi:hypothetical protein